MLNNKEKYHQSIALEFKSKIDRLGYFLKYENGTRYHKFRMAVEEELSIPILNNLLKDLLINEVKKGGIWGLFVEDILDCPPEEYLVESMIDYNSNLSDFVINLDVKKQIINHFFENNTLQKETFLSLRAKTIELTPKNIQNFPEGNYREYLLIEHLRKILPSTVKVGTGFIIDENYHTTNQIDIIVYDANVAPLFQAGDLVVVVPKSVYGIIEVKTTHYPDKLKSELENAGENHELILRSIEMDNPEKIFNGIFYFKSELTPKNIEDGCKTLRILREFEKTNFIVNHIAFGDSIFVRNTSEFSFYNMSKGNLAFAYFISNLIDIIMRKKGLSNEALSKFIFPIEESGGKETRKISAP